MEQLSPFNPLAKRNLGESVADALLLQDPVPLPPPEPFIAAGIYAIYYMGDFSLYREVARRNRNNKWKWPIYVGKAIPAGARKGGLGLDCKPGLVLYNRLCEHAESIKQVNNLRVEDFSCRYLAVDDIWIPLAESMLIEMYKPLWNIQIEGFGNHDPGKGRHKQKKSTWDVIHQGRPWAEKLQPATQSDQEIHDVTETYIVSASEKYPEPSDD